MPSKTSQTASARLFFLFLTLASTCFPKPAPVTQEVVREFVASWSKTSSFEADFKQSTSYLATGETETTQGHVWVQKPGQLRWDETTSSQKLSQILNGKRLSLISERVRRPGYRTIDVWDNGLALLDKAAFSFLSQLRPLTESYDFSVKKQDKGMVWLELKPKTNPRDALVAEIAKPGYGLRALASETEESRVRIEFSRVFTHRPIASGVFEWSENKEKDRVIRHNK